MVLTTPMILTNGKVLVLLNHTHKRGPSVAHMRDYLYCCVLFIINCIFYIVYYILFNCILCIILSIVYRLSSLTCIKQYFIKLFQGLPTMGKKRKSHKEGSLQIPSKNVCTHCGDTFSGSFIGNHSRLCKVRTVHESTT